MNLIEFNNALLYSKKKQKSINVITTEEVKQFQELLLIGKDVMNTFDSLEDSQSFYITYPSIKKIMGKNAVECFYASKLKMLYKGVPNKLIYILLKAIKKYGKDNINLALNSVIDYVKSYAEDEYTYDDETYSVKDIIESLTGHSVKLITDSVRAVQVNDYYEVWIPDVCKVALIPEDIVKSIDSKDLENLEYSSTLGIHLNGVPLRTFNDRLGVTKNDFDLRECV